MNSEMVKGRMKRSWIIRSACIIISLFFWTFHDIYSQDGSDVISGWLEFSNARNSLYNHLAAEAYVLLNKRTEKTGGINSLEKWKERQLEIKKTLMDIAGPFPEKTPLNAKIMRTVKKEGFRIEHIIFESQPGFYVTSSLFIPDGLKKKEKAPAVIYCSGHSAEGYRSNIYLHVIQNLVRKGFIVFAFDPVGQGERLEYFDPEKGASVIGGPTREHSYPGAQAFIAGSSQAMYMIWDGIRAVDYLISRKEVDPLRIGITGRSGGGTQSAYIAAFDDRILALAPENYITNYKRLLQSIGPQDAEQNMLNIIARGLDHADFLIVRAPKPAIMITTTNDFFSIQGAKETETEVARIYKAYDKDHNFYRVEDDSGHASTLRNREAMYYFFRKHLDNPGSVEDEVTITLTKEEMQVTPTGQVSTSFDGETVFSMNRRKALNLGDQLNERRKDPESFLPEATAAARRLAGYREPSDIQDPVMTGRVKRKDHVMEKYFIRGEGDYVIPYLLYRPEKPSGKLVIYLHPSGKSAVTLPGTVTGHFIRQGTTLIVPDLLGIGETGVGSVRGDAEFEGASHNIWYASMISGRSITGIISSDIVRLIETARNTSGFDIIAGVAERQMAPALLHAACFTKAFDEVILLGPYLSYMSIVTERFYDPHFVMSAVPGALREYDLPDLAAALAPADLMIVAPVDGRNTPLEHVNDNQVCAVKTAYESKGALESLKIIFQDPDKSLQEMINELLW